MKFRIEQHPDAGAFSFQWFDNIYGKTNYENQVVLDIGADWGRTADYFLQKGAKRVIAVEGGEDWYTLLERNAKLIEGITPVFLWLKEPRDISNLIKTYNPDIVKISTRKWSDCENWLLRIPANIITTVPQYILLTAQYRTQVKKMIKLEKMFDRLNYQVNIQMHHVPVITAVSRSTEK